MFYYSLKIQYMNMSDYNTFWFLILLNDLELEEY